MIVTVTKGIRNKSNAYVANELSDKMYIESATMAQRFTGTFPVDVGTGVPGPGQDFSTEEQ